MAAILSARNISKIYGKPSNEVKALDKVSLDLEKGVFYALIGRSGSGKSTLLHVLSGLSRPTEGSVLVNGRELLSYSEEETAVYRRRYMGFIFQQYNLLQDYDIKTNILLPLLLDGRKPDRSFFGEIIEFLGLSEKLKQYPRELSGGEQQRTAIARSILTKPGIIFADEMTGNLDRETAEETMELLLACSGRFGMTVLAATHDLDIARKSDRLFHLEDGRLLH